MGWHIKGVPGRKVEIRIRNRRADRCSDGDTTESERQSCVDYHYFQTISRVSLNHIVCIAKGSVRCEAKGAGCRDP